MYERLKQICKEKGTTVTELCAQSTGSSGNLATWKKGKMNTDHLINCAKILGVSTDYILGIEERKEEKMKKIKSFYEKTSNLLAKSETSYESLLKEIGLDSILIQYYKAGFLPSELVINRISQKTQVTYKELMEGFESFYNSQLDSDLEVLISNFKGLNFDQKGGIAHYSCILKNNEPNKAADVLRLIDLNSNEVGLIKVYRSVSPEGQNEIIHQAYSVRDKEQKIFTDSTEDVAN